MVTIEQLETLLKQDENEHLEFKKAERNYEYDNVVKYSVALANEGGGHLILGITDKKPRRIVGSQAFSGRIEGTKERLTKDIHLRIDVQEIDHPLGRVIIFDIPSRPLGMPIHYEGRYLMRSGEALVPMSADLLQRIFNETGPDYSALPMPDAKLSDLDSLAIENFRKLWIRKTGNTSLQNRSVPELLTDAELIIKGQLTQACLILFGTKESLGQLLPQAEIIFEYRSSDASGAAQQRIEWRQGFFAIYDQIWQTLDLRNTLQHIQDGLFIWDIKTFNEAAIRETILNAVCHRDYRLQGSVFIRQYPQRLEVVSPGGLPTGINFENILWEQAPRNRRLAEVFSRCGLVERSGQGMNRIFESCIRESKALPDFSGSNEFAFWLVLHGEIRHPQFLTALDKIGSETIAGFSTIDYLILQNIFETGIIPNQYMNAAQRLLSLGIIEKSHQRGQWVLARRFYTITKTEGKYTRQKSLDRGTNKQLLVKHLENFPNQGAKMEEFRQILPFMSRSGIQVLLRELKKEGRVHSRGNTNAGRWFLGPEQPDCNKEKES